MKKLMRPVVLALVILGLLLLGLRTAQARRFAQVDGSNYFDIMRVCRDGIEIGFARNGPSVDMTGAWWVQAAGNELILAQENFTLVSSPVPVPGGTASHSDYFTRYWLDSTMLMPGHRIKMVLNETDSQDIWATVGDCLVDDGRFAAEWWVFPDTSQDENNGGALPAGNANFQITVVMTQPIADVNVAMFVENDSTGDVLTLTASLTSPEGTTVQLFSQVGDQGKNFGARCRKQNGTLIGDPLADLVLDDVSLFDFTTPDVFRSAETPYAIHPQQPLDAFRGENGSGVWTLQLQKNSTTPATLRCWMLQITDGAAPNPVTISGPTSGSLNTLYEFTAAVEPISTTLPLTMTWQASGQSTLISQTYQLTDTAAFSWDSYGLKTITVTAENGIGFITDTFEINIPSPTPTSTPSNTPTATATPTATPSNTPTATATPVPAPSNTPTATPVPAPSNTPTATPLPAPSNTPTATATPVPAPSNTPTATPVPAPSNTPTATPLPAPSNTPTATPLPGPSNTPTATATPLPGPSNTPTATATPVPGPSNTPTATATPTATPITNLKYVYLPSIVNQFSPLPPDIRAVGMAEEFAAVDFGTTGFGEPLSGTHFPFFSARFHPIRPAFPARGRG